MGTSGFGFSFIVLDLPLYGAELGSRFLKYFAVSSLFLKFLTIVLFLGSDSSNSLIVPSSSFSISGSLFSELSPSSSNESCPSSPVFLLAFFYSFSYSSSAFLSFYSSLSEFHSSITCLKAFGSYPFHLSLLAS